MIGLGELLAAAVRLQQRYYAEGARFCFIGGIALQKWGEPRFTRDIDVSLFAGFGGERAVIQRELNYLDPRIDNASDFALLNRVLLVRDASGCPIDIALAAMPFELEMIERSRLEKLDSDFEPLRLCSPTDLLILKTLPQAARLGGYTEYSDSQSSAH